MPNTFKSQEDRIRQVVIEVFLDHFDAKKIDQILKGQEDAKIAADVLKIEMDGIRDQVTALFNDTFPDGAPEVVTSDQIKQIADATAREAQNAANLQAAIDAAPHE